CRGAERRGSEAEGVAGGGAPRRADGAVGLDQDAEVEGAEANVTRAEGPAEAGVDMQRHRRAHALPAVDEHAGSDGAEDAEAPPYHAPRFDAELQVLAEDGGEPA